MKKTTRFPADNISAFSLFIIAFAILAADLACPFEGAYRTPGGYAIQGWTSTLVRHIYPVLLVAATAFSVWAWRFVGRLVPETTSGMSKLLTAAKNARPLLWLPAIAMFRHSAGWFGVEFPALAIPFAVPALIAWTAFNFLYPTNEDQKNDNCGNIRPAWIVFAAALVFFVAMQVTFKFGETTGGGDVCHYNFQLTSLVETGSLDLTDKIMDQIQGKGILGATDAEEQYIRYSHMRRNSNGRIFSVHGYGYPLLAWPFALLGGFIGVSLLNLLIGAATVTGIFVCAGKCGASLKSSVIATSLLAASFFWVYTVHSRLPEMLGCALCIWGFWAVFAQSSPNRKLAASITVVLTAGYIPFAHFRFVPVAVIILLAFLTEGIGWRNGESRGKCFLRLAITTALVTAAWTVAFCVHRFMFAGVGSFSIDTILLSRPWALLGVFTDQRGVPTVFPVIWLLALAPVYAMGIRGQTRRMAVLAMLLEIATLIFCCANLGTLRGSCMTGRYFLQAIPALVPFGALYLDRCGRPGKYWYLFLSLIPVLYLMAIAPFSTSLNELTRAPMTLWKYDLFQNCWMPFVLVFAQIQVFPILLGAVMPLLMIIASGLLSGTEKHTLRTGAAVTAIAIGIGFGLYISQNYPYSLSTSGISLAHRNHWREFVAVSAPENPSFDAFFHKELPDVEPLFALGPDAHTVNASHFLEPASRKPNDPLNRPMVWTPLRVNNITANKHSIYALHVTGEVKKGSLFVATKHGRIHLPKEGVQLNEGPFEVFFLVKVVKDIKTNVIAALGDASDEAIINRLDIYPYAPGLEKAVGGFPEKAFVIDLIPPKKP